MEQIKQFCLDTIKAEYILTKEFLYVNHNAMTGRILNVVKDYLNSSCGLLIVDNGMLFIFSILGVCNTREKIDSHIKMMLETDKEYILARGENQL